MWPPAAMFPGLIACVTERKPEAEPSRLRWHFCLHMRRRCVSCHFIDTDGLLDIYETSVGEISRSSLMSLDPTPLKTKEKGSLLSVIDTSMKDLKIAAAN